MASRYTRTKVLCKVIVRPMKYWVPGTDVVKEILRTYRDKLKSGDIIVVSDKALSIAYGSIYDEKTIRVDKITKALTFIVSRIFWARLMQGFFQMIHYEY